MYYGHFAVLEKSSRPSEAGIRIFAVRAIVECGSAPQHLYRTYKSSTVPLWVLHDLLNKTAWSKTLHIHVHTRTLPVPRLYSLFDSYEQAQLDDGSKQPHFGSIHMLFIACQWSIFAILYS